MEVCWRQLVSLFSHVHSTIQPTTRGQKISVFRSVLLDYTNLDYQLARQWSNSDSSGCTSVSVVSPCAIWHESNDESPTYLCDGLLPSDVSVSHWRIVGVEMIISINCRKQLLHTNNLANTSQIHSTTPFKSLDLSSMEAKSVSKAYISITAVLLFHGCVFHTTCRLTMKSNHHHVEDTLSSRGTPDYLSFLADAVRCLLDIPVEHNFQD